MVEDARSKGQREVVPTQNSSGIQAARLWNITYPPKLWIAVKSLSVLTLVTGAGWCFQEFSQLRGWVSLLASRLFLAFCGLFVVATWYVITSGFTRKVAYRLVGFVVIVGGLFVIDRIAPHPSAAVALAPAASFVPVKEVSKIEPRDDSKPRLPQGRKRGSRPPETFFFVFPTTVRADGGDTVVTLQYGRRGRDPILNGKVLFVDYGTEWEELMNSPNHTLSGPAVTALRTVQEIPEFDALGGFGIGDPGPTFAWKLHEPDHAELSVALSHRFGVSSELIYLRKVRSEWRSAIRVEGSQHNVLLYCRDDPSLADAHWFREQGIPGCTDAIANR